jgi:hypothetical protein
MSLTVSHLPRTILVLGICAASAMASAEIHRCKDENGRTVLTDRPCGAASAGPTPQSALGTGIDRIDAPEMNGGRSRDSGAQYEILQVRSTRGTDAQAMR